MKINSKQAKPFSAIAFPDYTGRKFFVEYKESITLYDLNWGGGTRNYYKVICLDTLELNPVSVKAPWIENKEGETVRIPKGFIIIKHSFFCGNDCGITIFINPEDAPKLLK